MKKKKADKRKTRKAKLKVHKAIIALRGCYPRRVSVILAKLHTNFGG